MRNGKCLEPGVLFLIFLVLMITNGTTNTEFKVNHTNFKPLIYLIV